MPQTTPELVEAACRAEGRAMEGAMLTDEKVEKAFAILKGRLENLERTVQAFIDGERDGRNQFRADFNRFKTHADRIITAPSAEIENNLKLCQGMESRYRDLASTLASLDNIVQGLMDQVTSPIQYGAESEQMTATQLSVIQDAATARFNAWCEELFKKLEKYMNPMEQELAALLNPEMPFAHFEEAYFRYCLVRHGGPNTEQWYSRKTQPPRRSDHGQEANASTGQEAAGAGEEVGRQEPAGAPAGDEGGSDLGAEDDPDGRDRAESGRANPSVERPGG